MQTNLPVILDCDGNMAGEMDPWLLMIQTQSQ